ncbi:MAG: hypothetical protein NXI22_16170 [bacterium]|nr:hypothetical protein [bacterium]
MPTINEHNAQLLKELGFCFDAGGTHLARTMMFDDLAQVFEHCGTSLTRDSVIQAIDEDNCLGKPSAKSRKLAARHLVKLYGFDDRFAIYRALAFLWSRDEESRRLLALLIAYARDAILRLSATFIFTMQDGDPYKRERLEEFIDEKEPGRFSPAMLRSAAQNIAGTWTQSGHLTGRSKKTRTFVEPHAGAAAMATFISYLTGRRGQLTFESEYVKLLDCSATTTIELVKTAAQRGWMDVKHIGSVIEVSFPRILTSEELEKIREQN